MNYRTKCGLLDKKRTIKFSSIIIKAQGYQISLTKVRSPIYSIALIKKMIMNLIHRPLRRLPPKVLNIRIRALKPLVFLANILNISNINTLHNSDINTIYIEYIYIYKVYSSDITIYM